MHLLRMAITACVYDDVVVLNNEDKFLGKNRRHATKDIDSMYIWLDTEPDDEELCEIHP